ncbi:hypothetical protein CJ430_31785, partial [Klebsiella pneumoniae]
ISPTWKANRYQRYIGAHLGAQNRHKRFYPACGALRLISPTWKANRYQRYIGAHLGAQNRHKRFYPACGA